MKRLPLFILTGALALAGILLVEFTTGNAGRHEVSLYQRIGGPSGATTIAEGFLASVGGDDRLVVRFAEADMDALRGPLSDLLCEATGGPCWYEGDGMLDVRRRPGVTEEVFGIMARHFAAAMIDAGIGTYDQYAAMEAYLAMHDTIVRNGPRFPVDAPGGYFQVSGG
ncbi:MAG: group 1 truncated hemoglobin [Immundisolibacterales bacterium]|nr:group 1 truncated hemoglobin [Immundisolibacterales bacterium]